MKRLFCFLICSSILPLLPTQAVAESLTICSQNLNNYGGRVSGKRKGNQKKHRRQESFLVERVVDARCDVVATQEVIGKDSKQALEILETLARKISEDSGRLYRARIGKSLDRRIRNGYIVAQDVGELLEVKTFNRKTLPKLQWRSRSHRYSRGPLGLLLKTKSGKRFYFLNVHLKSKADSWKDPTKTKFELLRMEMAEGLREIVASERSRLGDDVVFTVLGDINSDYLSAAALVLSGERLLEDFRHEFRSGKGCRVDEELNAECQSLEKRRGSLVRLFARWAKARRGAIGGGSYRYKGQPYIIDEIAVARKHVRLIEKDSVRFAGTFRRGSDHKMVKARFAWDESTEF